MAQKRSMSRKAFTEIKKNIISALMEEYDFTFAGVSNSDTLLSTIGTIRLNTTKYEVMQNN